MPLTEQATTRLRAIIDDACADRQTGVPGAAVVVVDRDGSDLFAHAAGTQGLANGNDKSDLMTVDSVFWIASCTKMITGIACMQLVERGVLRLDDSDQLEELCPELRDVRILAADGSRRLLDKERPLTLRMLLTHTAGFGYSFFDERLRDWSQPAGLDEFSAQFEDLKQQPLLFQPGDGWKYGVSVEWAGVAVERATGLRLGDYMQQNIFQPLGLDGIAMIPSDKMRSQLAHMHSRRSDGTLVPRDHLYRRPLLARTPEEAAACFHNGGGGLFARPRDYCRVLAVLLNDGTCPRTGAQILQKDTVADMFRNQIPHLPGFALQPTPAAKPELASQIPQLYSPSLDGSPPGWGLSFMLNGDAGTGRSSDTAHWAGLSNLFWWCDRGRGVAGMVCAQLLPFPDAKVLGLWAAVESVVNGK